MVAPRQPDWLFVENGLLRKAVLIISDFQNARIYKPRESMLAKYVVCPNAPNARGILSEGVWY